MKQTAVEWLEKRYDWTKGQLIQLDFDKAKAMEKEQIKDAYWDGGQDIPLTEERCNHYYNETFKSE